MRLLHPLSPSKRPKCSYPEPRLSRVSGIKTCQIEQKTQETAQILLQSPWQTPTERVNFISLSGESFTDEGYNHGQVALFTFNTSR